MNRPPPKPPPFPYPPLFRSPAPGSVLHHPPAENGTNRRSNRRKARPGSNSSSTTFLVERRADNRQAPRHEKCRSEEHTSELQSLTNLVCRLLLEIERAHV